MMLDTMAGGVVLAFRRWGMGHGYHDAKWAAWRLDGGRGYTDAVLDLMDLVDLVGGTRGMDGMALGLLMGFNGNASEIGRSLQESFAYYH